MAIDMQNDTEGAVRQRVPDAHGNAALLLAESLLHGLVAKSVISVEDAAEIVNIAIEAESELDADRADPRLAKQTSHTLLNSIGASLNLDLPRESDGAVPLPEK